MKAGALVLIAVLWFVGCAGFSQNAAKTLEGIRQVAASSRQTLPLFCGEAGSRYYEDCKGGSVEACEGFKKCHTASKTIESALLAVLAGQHALIEFDSDPSDQKRGIVEKAIGLALKLSSDVQKTLQAWGLGL